MAHHPLANSPGLCRGGSRSSEAAPLRSSTEPQPPSRCALLWHGGSRCPRASTCSTSPQVLPTGSQPRSGGRSSRCGPARAIMGREKVKSVGAGRPPAGLWCELAQPAGGWGVRLPPSSEAGGRGWRRRTLMSWGCRCSWRVLCWGWSSPKDTSEGCQNLRALPGLFCLGFWGVGELSKLVNRRHLQKAAMAGRN